MTNHLKTPPNAGNASMGYGGARLPHVDQRPSAFLRHLSRAIKGRGLQLVVSRPVDGFKGFTIQSASEALWRGGAMDGNLLSFDLAHSPISCQLRFLIISEVCLTGERFNQAVNRPVSLALTGFEGF